ncbi:lysylphosphatidylglycerol synthase transmembrane domain-containing protein [Deinococcus maricopensis]|uniref:Lysylphosphatidylglycerol synthetase/UPF0104 n=1 Tax=Deinococcus maricopensis (strain DSM 21211 / LMG 22137 / NRRL B-23946 / LB-34) TaxID=709986 RepID=E8UA52_DEIML|nr:lysylphosphatidylglycerol synthase transmembrane domain-containing protein [Deinococcus maricopensis]ADV67941.1 Lysylphosphatidylglycerol synthetase/UPF0104 [Deinococcus maricopensis DSM 21211]
MTRNARARAWTWALNLIVLGSLLLAAHRYVNGEDLLGTLRRAHFGVLALAALLGLTYTFIKGVRFVGLTRPVGAPPGRTVLHAYIAAEAATILPGGVAMRAALLAQAGLPVARGSVPVLLASVQDQLVLATCALLGTLAVPSARPAVLGALGAFALIGAALAVPGLRRAASGALNALLTRAGAPGAWAAFTGGAAQVLRGRTLLITTLITFASVLVKIIALAACLAAVGASAPIVTLCLATVLPTMLGRLTPIPGGVGVTEAGMVTLLAASGVHTEMGLAASLLFRVTTVFVPVLIGAAVYFLTWRPRTDLQQPT